ncbi:MAG: cell division protein FtsZ [Alphaproteobacteria bacterium]|nr:cell division protein FtsZ [Alphaproteobacteria bacterium]
MINLSIAETENNLRPRIAVMGVGGAGGNAVNNMIRSTLEGCDFIVANTDAQALQSSLAPRKIQLGINHTRGLGAGSKAEVGRAAAEEQMDDIMACLHDADMVFVTAGMGGGTGTGAAPVIARAAREAGILTVGVVTKPFHFEGTRRMNAAEGGLAELQQYVDTLIVIPNQNLFRLANERTTFAEAFQMADEVLHAGVRGITDLMVMPGFMNLDFADVKTVMAEMGKAMMGTGESEGDNRAIRAAEASISNPLLDDVSLEGARGVLINITGGMDMTLFEVDQAANRIREEVDSDAQIKVGSTLSEALDGKIRVSVIATGIEPALVEAQIAAAGQGNLHIPSKNQGSRGSRSATGTGTVGISITTAPRGVDVTRAQVVAPAAAVVTRPAAPASPPAAASQQAQAATQEEERPATPAQMDMLSETAGDEPMAAEAAPAPEPAPAPVAAEAPRQQAQFVPPRPATAPRSQPAATGAGADTRITQISPGAAMPAQAAGRNNASGPRAESLFRRITGFGLVRPTEQAEAPRQNPPQTVVQKATQAMAQARLGIDPSDRPVSSAGAEDDVLDIPAFLRRQTNH